MKQLLPVSLPLNLKMVFFIVLTHQHDGEIDTNIGFEEERFEIVCHMTDKDHDECGEIDCQYSAHETTAQHNLFKQNLI